MTNGQILLKESRANAWQKKTFKVSPRKVDREQKELSTLHLSTLVVKTGAKRYGLPADAKERRM